MEDQGDILGHSVFGDMGWMAGDGVWFTELELPSGAWVAVVVRPGKAHPKAFLDSAGELFWWAVNHGAAVRRKAARAKLLKLYNDRYRADGELELSEKQLAARLQWQVLTFNATKGMAVEFEYETGELFGYRSVSITVDTELGLREVALTG